MRSTRRPGVAVKSTLDLCPDLLRSIDACGDSVFVVDEGWTIVHWNPVAEAAFGRSAAEVVQRHLLGLWHAQFEGLPRGATLPDGSRQISATGPVYRGPGAPANGPPHHYVFELYALDIVLDVPGTDDAFATRTKVIEAMQGRILGKAVYLGLFRRPA